LTRTPCVLAELLFNGAMDHHVAHFVGLLALALVVAKACGHLLQPAVLGELLAGVILGRSVLGLIDPNNDVMQLLAELGVIILLFEIGLETDLRKLLHVGVSSAVVAAVGVILPFALGYGTCLALGTTGLVAVVAGAALTATSVGITARVLADLGRLQEPESQIILGAAVLDDVAGLVILTIVAGVAEGQGITAFGVAKVAAIAVGFLLATLLLGNLLVPPIMRLLEQWRLPGGATMLGIILALALASLADLAGSAMIIGAFAAGLLLARTPQAHEITKGIGYLGQFLVPLFFVTVGAQVNVRVFNVLDPANRPTLWIGGLLILVAVLSKFVAGYAPFWFRGRKSIIGVGMIPRGEVGLIFAQMGLATGVFQEGLFSAVTLMVMVTTFMAPPLLKFLFQRKRIATHTAIDLRASSSL
jgi:Kef-type K+ transport system membrane component KefB